MAKPDKRETKRKRNRKARTEVSPSPSSSSSSASAVDERLGSPQGPDLNDTSDGIDAAERASGTDAEDSEDKPATPPPNDPSDRDPQATFAEFYLKQSTREFADDLEKLRAAKDFRGESSVGLLVRALRQGTECFSADEMAKVGGAKDVPSSTASS